MGPQKSSGKRARIKKREMKLAHAFETAKSGIDHYIGLVGLGGGGGFGSLAGGESNVTTEEEEGRREVPSGGDSISGA